MQQAKATNHDSNAHSSLWQQHGKQLYMQQHMQRAKADV